MKAARTEIKITGQVKTDFTKVEKKFMQSIKNPTGDNFYCQCTIWVPSTPGYSKAPKVVLTLNNHRDKIQLLFPSAIDLSEFCSTLNRFCESQLKEVNNAHNEAVKDYQIFHELLLYQADQRAKEKAAQAFADIKKPDTTETDFLTSNQ